MLGTHRPNWLGLTDVPLFVSQHTLGLMKRLPRARGPWCLDSGGFTELTKHGGWTISAADYVAAARRYIREIGNLRWAAPQDWMCEPFVVAKTGLTVTAHQARTIASVLDLRSSAPEVPWIPVLQGWAEDDYLRHVDAYDRAGIDLQAEPVVGIGTVCRRQSTALAERVIQRLWRLGISLHGFGFKVLGLRRSAPFLLTADSLAWSFGARRNPQPCPVGNARHKNCANCLQFALLWRRRLLDSLLQPRPRQLSLEAVA